MRKVEKTNDNFVMLKEECLGFLDVYDDIDEKLTHEALINQAKEFKNLIRLGVFGDAVGKVTKEDEKFIYIED